jgi:osmotically inducible protein OsmC
MKRKASAAWMGGLKDGKGTVSTESGALKERPYSFSTRFENEAGTNPEELVAAAHASCFSMALSSEMEKAGMRPESVRTSATVSLEKGDGGFAVHSVHLETRVRAPGADRATFETAAAAAKTGCPISKLLNAEITLDARLED